MREKTARPAKYWLPRVLSFLGICYVLFFVVLYLNGMVSEQRASELYNASGTNNLPEVIRLLDNGVPVDAECEAGTALQAAVIARNTRIVKLLVERGADPKRVSGYERKSPVQLARNDPEVLNALLPR